MKRSIDVARKTGETDIEMFLNLDGTGQYEVRTDCGFMKHMLELFARHGGFDLNIRCVGDHYVDDHHAVEDMGIVLGKGFKEALGDKVTQVVISTRIADAAACITTEGPLSLEMERILNQGPEGEQLKAQRVLQLNSGHKVFQTLKDAFEADDKAKLRLYTDLLYNQALLVEGMPIEDPLTFAEEICKLM